MSDDFIGLRQFKLRLKELTVPTRVVTTRGDVQALGTWIPEGVSFEITAEVSSTEKKRSVNASLLLDEVEEEPATRTVGRST